MTRFIFYIDKGDYGRGTIAAATAIALAEQGKSTLLLSTAKMYDVADLLGVELSKDKHVQEVMPNLSVQTSSQTEQEDVTILLDMLQNTRKAHYSAVVVDSLVAAEAVQWLMSAGGQGADLRSVLRDANNTSFRLVVTPDTLSLKRGRRAATSLSLFGYPLDAVIINGVLPTENLSDDTFFGNLQALQAHHVMEAYDHFTPLPVLEVPYYDVDMVGIETLKQVGQDMWSDGDADAVHYQGMTLQIEDGKVRMPLLFARLQDVEIAQDHNTVYVGVGMWQRSISLSRTVLSGCAVTRATLQDGVLEIDFE